MFRINADSFVSIFAMGIPIVAIIGGITVAIVRTIGQQRLAELAHRERIAALERGVDPSKLPPAPVLVLPPFPVLPPLLAELPPAPTPAPPAPTTLLPPPPARPPPASRPSQRRLGANKRATGVFEEPPKKPETSSTAAISSWFGKKGQ